MTQTTRTAPLSRSFRALALLCAAAAVAVPTGLGDRAVRAQSSSGPLSQPGPIPMQHSPLNDEPGQSPERQQKLAEARNAERQKRLVQDTDKLLELATELKADVDKTDKNVLSIDVVKRAEEIEKLARSVKEHMKG